jgi:ankyrin repeat protein
LDSLSSGVTLRQYRDSGPSASTQNEPFQEVRVDQKDYTLSPEDGTRICKAVALGDHKALSDLLIIYKTSVNTIDKEGNTALHFAVASVCQNDDLEGCYQCIDLLMSCKEMKVNIPNKRGYTAIGYAVNERHKACVEHMLKHPSADRLYLDCYPGGSESTVRKIIVKIYPELQPLLTAPLMERLDSSDRDIKLLAALQENEFNIFSKNVDSNNPNPWYDEPYHSSLLEIASQMKNRKQFVTDLLDKGSDPNIKNRVTGMPLIHATARSGNFEVLEILLERQNVNLYLLDNKKRTILHWWARVSERNQGDKERLENCFKQLLQWDFCGVVGIDCKDKSGMTPLSTAIECENRERVILLLGNGADVTAYERAGSLLESSCTSVLEDILDYCLESNNEPVKSEHLEVTLKYRTLQKLLFLAEVPHHADILRHPVFSVFFHLTWNKTVKFHIFGAVLDYIIFLIFLTSYVLHFDSVYTVSHRSVANNTNGLFSANDSHMTYGMNDEKWYNISTILRTIVLGLMIYFVFFWSIELIIYPKGRINSTDNWLKLLLSIVIFTSCSGIVDSIETTRHLFAIAILLGWFEFLLILGRLPLFSVQTEMLKEVSLSFLIFIARYMVLILAFAFSFYILFKKDVKGNDVDLFTNPFKSLLKTLVMFTGEFDFSDLPLDTLPYTSHVIFMLFVFLMAVVLLNLLNGLAVGDTEKIRKIAETVSLMATARMTSKVLGMLPIIPSWYARLTGLYDLTEEMLVFYPNKPNQIVPSDLKSLRRIITKKRKMSKNVKSTEQVENLSRLAEELTELRQEVKEMREILIKILNK